MPVSSPLSGAADARRNASPAASYAIREDELVAIVHAARAGDADAWTRLVQTFERTLRFIARSYRLAPADVDEVVQTTWLDLLRAIHSIHEPAAIGGWLATAARRNALRQGQIYTREQLTDEPDVDRPCDFNCPEADLLAGERREALVAAFAGLPDRQRRLMRILLAQPTLSYGEVGQLLGMPIGSIGPVRARALARLARDEQLRAVIELPAPTQPSLVAA